MSLLKNEIKSQLGNKGIVLSKEALREITLDEIFILLHLTLIKSYVIKPIILFSRKEIDLDFNRIYFKRNPPNINELMLLVRLIKSEFIMNKNYDEECNEIYANYIRPPCNYYGITDNYCNSCKNGDMDACQFALLRYKKIYNWDTFNDKLKIKKYKFYDENNKKFCYSASFIEEFKTKMYEYGLPIKMIKLIIDHFAKDYEERVHDNMENMLERYLSDGPKSARNI